MNDLIYWNNNINEKKRYSKHKIYRKFNKRDKNREKRRYWNKSSSSNLEKKNYRMRFSTFFAFSTSIFLIIASNNKSRTIFAFFNISYIVQNLFNNFVKIKKNLKKQIEIFINWEIDFFRCLSFEREYNNFLKIENTFIVENLNFRTMQTKKNDFIWWIEQNIKFDIDEKLIIDAKIFEKI